LIDARQGVLTQTKRHSFIVSLLGIRHVVVTVNKMDLVGFSEQRFDEICEDYRAFASRLELPDVHFIPIAALHGDNLVDASPNMPWYKGSTLMNMLESVYIGSDRNLVDFRLPVQYVNRPNLDFRGFCGTLSSGVVRTGEEVMILPSKRTSRVKRIVTFDGDQAEAFAPQSVTLVLEDEVDCSRGDMIVHPGNEPHVSQDVAAMVVWMDDQSPLVPGKEYLLKHGPNKTPASVTAMQVVAARAAAGLCLPGTSVPSLDRKDGRGVDDPLVHAACAVCMLGSTGHAGPARPTSPAPALAAIAVASVDPGARHGAAAHLRPGSRAPPGAPLA
jgi:bifunctional enzyme CysN/CysC